MGAEAHTISINHSSVVSSKSSAVQCWNN